MVFNYKLQNVSAQWSEAYQALNGRTALEAAGMKTAKLKWDWTGHVGRMQLGKNRHSIDA